MRWRRLLGSLAARARPGGGPRWDSCFWQAIRRTNKSFHWWGREDVSGPARGCQRYPGVLAEADSHFAMLEPSAVPGIPFIVNRRPPKRDASYLYQTMPLPPLRPGRHSIGSLIHCHGSREPGVTEPSSVRHHGHDHSRSVLYVIRAATGPMWSEKPRRRQLKTQVEERTPRSPHPHRVSNALAADRESMSNRPPNAACARKPERGLVAGRQAPLLRLGPQMSARAWRI